MLFSLQLSPLKTLFTGVMLLSLAACQTDLAPTQQTLPEAGPGAAVANIDAAPNPTLTRALPPVTPIAPTAAEPITNLWDRIRDGLELQDYYDHPDVVAQLEHYAGNQAYFDLVVTRAAPFLFTIVAELERRGLPQELALLPFVESGFNLNAYSPEHAVGLWQFMGATAKSYGLQLDWWYDGRRDPVASTIAALDYLEALHAQFDGDWLLALAAYNAGDGNVRRAIRRAKKSGTAPQFWDLPLPRETRSHVPRVLALGSLINAIGNHAVELAPIANENPLAIVEIGAQIDLAQAARLAQFDYTELRGLNAGYLQWATHPDQPQHLLLPAQPAQRLLEALAALPPSQLLSWDHYEIQPGDTLGSIARKLETRVDVLLRVNNLRDSRIIAGRSLLIPRGSEALIGSSSIPVIAPTRAPAPLHYRVRSGDNLWRIARRFDLRSQDIADWNGLDKDAILRPGRRLTLRASASATTSAASGPATSYVVERGDTLGAIARQFNVDLDELRRWNKLANNTQIFPDQILQLQPAEHRLN